jgi:hypothetical protein
MNTKTLLVGASLLALTALASIPTASAHVDVCGLPGGDVGDPAHLIVTGTAACGGGSLTVCAGVGSAVVTVAGDCSDP